MPPAMPSTVREWQRGGRWVHTAAGRLFVRTVPGGEPVVVFLHGYPSSSYDFRHLIGRIGDHACIAIDLLGFGLSDKPRPHRYSIFEHADLVERLIAVEVGERPVDIVAHDMGTSVATELMARDVNGALGFRLRRVVLSNAGIIIERASLRPIQRLLLSPLGWTAARLANRPMFTREFARLFSPGHPLDPAEAAAQWALISRAGGHRIAHLLCHYVRERAEHADRWHGAIRDWPGPLGFIWGLRDPVATVHVLDGLRELRPSAPVIKLPDLGHYPQIEDPAAFTAGVLSLLGG
ncbi:MAG: alpha/beta fold hydrolase [Pseudonocardiaceae bacterium]